MPRSRLRGFEESSHGTLRRGGSGVGAGSGHRLPALGIAKLNEAVSGGGAKQRELLVPREEEARPRQGPGPPGEQEAHATCGLGLRTANGKKGGLNRRCRRPLSPGRTVEGWRWSHGTMEAKSRLEATSGNLKVFFSAAHTALCHLCPFPPQGDEGQAAGGCGQRTQGL